MENVINKINNNLINKNINNVNKNYFYNRNTLYVDLEYYLNTLNQPLINIINKNCCYSFKIINYEKVNINLDCNNNKIVDSIFYLSNKYENFLINTNIYIDNSNNTNFNKIKIHNSEDTNYLNQSRDILNNNYNTNSNNYIPNNDDTLLEFNELSYNYEKIKIKANEYNNSYYNCNNIPNFYKCNYELTPELNNNNYLFEGSVGLKGAYNL